MYCLANISPSTVALEVIINSSNDPLTVAAISPVAVNKPSLTVPPALSNVKRDSAFKTPGVLSPVITLLSALLLIVAVPDVPEEPEDPLAPEEPEDPLAPEEPDDP
tara:strand:- start:183 stop:500 length:318 start_codon:yes stop_codon:yes gene_type:complete